MFVDIHRIASTRDIFGLRASTCSNGSGENGDYLAIDDNEDIEVDSIYKNGDYCHICAACTSSIAASSSSPSFAFRTLTLLYDILGSEAFSMLVYHLLIGNQVVVRSCVCSNRVLLDALKLLLPSNCIKCVDSSREYREPWECNLVGLLIDHPSFDSAQNGDGGRPKPMNRDLPQSLSNTGDSDGCVILSVDYNQAESRNGYADYSSRLIAPSLLKDGTNALPRDGYHFRVCCTAAASSNNYLDTESPALMQSLLNLLSTAFSKCCLGDEGAAAGLAVLESLKDEWLRKAKLYYVMSKKYNAEDDAWRKAFFRVSKCSAVDEPILKFWRSGLSRQFKQSVLSEYSLKLLQSQDSGKMKDGKIKNGM